jgi:hypothetical protein
LVYNVSVRPLRLCFECLSMTAALVPRQSPTRHCEERAGLCECSDVAIPARQVANYALLLPVNAEMASCLAMTCTGGRSRVRDCSGYRHFDKLRMTSPATGNAYIQFAVCFFVFTANLYQLVNILPSPQTLSTINPITILFS